MAKQNRDLQQGIQDGVRIKAMAAAARAETDDDEDEDEGSPRKRKRRRRTVLLDLACISASARQSAEC